MAIAVLLGLGVSGAVRGAPTAPAPSSQPTSNTAPKYLEKSHTELLEEARQTPLLTVEIKSAAGKPLSEAEKADQKKADDLMKAAASARKNGDFKAASEAARDAMNIYQKLFGAGHYLTISSSIETSTMDQFKSLSPAEKQDLVEADRQMEAAEAATLRGDFYATRTAARKVLETRERILGKNHAALIVALRVLGNAQIELGAIDDAQQALVRAVDLVESGYGKNHPQTALVLDRLAWLRVYQSRREAACAQLRRAVWILKNAQGEIAETAESLDNLGTALAYSGEFEEALQSKLRALVIREKLLGPDAKDTAVSMSNLAWLYTRIGKPAEVIPLRKKALAVFEKVLGPDHHDTIIELSNLAQVYFGADKFSEAADLYEQQIARDEKRTGPLDSGPVNRLLMLGSVYLKSGRQADAEKALQRAVDKGIKLYESGERGAAITELMRVVFVYEYYRMLEDATKVRETILKWDESQGTLATAETVQRAAQLGRVYTELGRTNEANDLLTKTVGQAKMLFGESGVWVMSPLISLAAVYEKMGKLDDAVKICEQVLRLAESKLSKVSPSSVFAVYLLGRIQLEQKNTDIAKFSLEEALDRNEHAQRPDQTMKASILRELAACHQTAGEKDEAKKLFDKSIDVARELSKDGNYYHAAELAESIKRLLDADAGGLPLDAGRDALRNELRGLLEKLRAARALDAENKKWLQEFSSTETRP